MKEKTVCFECGAVLAEGNSYTLDGNTMCEECFESLTVTCYNCDARIWRGDIVVRRNNNENPAEKVRSFNL